MINRLIKVVLSLIVFISLIIFYLSFFGITTVKLNNKIINKISGINKKVNLELKSVKFLLDPFNFTVKVETKNPYIKVSKNKLKLESIKTNISLISLINNEFSIDSLKISTKTIKIKDLILLARSYKNSPELFILNKIIIDGLLLADINLNFNKEGKIKNDFKINGLIRNSNLTVHQKFNIKNLNMHFELKKNKYTLRELKTNFNQIDLSAPLIEVNDLIKTYFIKGKILSKEKNIDIKEFSTLFKKDYKKLNIKKIYLSSNNEFSFKINKKLKIDDLKFKSKINLKEFHLENNFIKLKNYFPNLEKLIKLEKHIVIIDYKKDQFDISGHGNFLIKDVVDHMKYSVIKKNKLYKFNTNISIEKNPFNLTILDYKKKSNLKASISIAGVYEKNNNTKFNLISFKENQNKVLIKGLNLNKNFKINYINQIDLNYKNTNKILNNINLKKDRDEYKIDGKSFDAIKLINNLMQNEKEKPSLFNKFNSKININILKTYIDKNNFVNNLSGILVFQNNKTKSVKLETYFLNKKKLTLSIKTNKDNSKVTTLFTDFPKPLIKRYKFIEGFEGGTLDFYSLKQGSVSNSVLKIDNFKVKKVPIFAKLLSLASLKGIADLLTGEGIAFTDFEMKFSNKRGLTTINEMYSVGPAVSILMDGYIENKKLVSLRGTLVPATTINRTIASIPLLGNILVGKKVGEGVFGVSFKIKGPPNDIKTSVNPVKTLTPRFITRTLEKIKKN